MSELDLGSLLNTVTAKITSQYSDDAWYEWKFLPTSTAGFSRAATLYSQGHQDYAFLQLFRVIETQLRLTNLTLRGLIRKLFEVLSEFLKLQLEGKADEAEKILEKLEGPAPLAMKDRVETIINELKSQGLIYECEMYTLHALRCYRNDVIHQQFGELELGMFDALILLSVPIIKRLDDVMAKAAKRSFST